MQRIILLFILLSLGNQLFSQNNSPYKTSLKADLPLILGGAAASIGGYLILNDTLAGGINDQTFPDTAAVLALGPNDLPWHDRSGAYQDFDSKIRAMSDNLFIASMLYPTILLFHDRIRENAGQMAVIYTETLLATAVAYTFTAGLTSRKRPMVYNQDMPPGVRLRNGNKNSFYNGHGSLVAATSFFTAKVYWDFHPDAKPWIFGLAAVPPIVQSYLRYKTGMHYFSESVAGIGVGAAIGVLVPHLHKDRPDNAISFHTTGNGVRVLYKFP